jgi:hypothetical protein
MLGDQPKFLPSFWVFGIFGFFFAFHTILFSFSNRIYFPPLVLLLQHRIFLGCRCKLATASNGRSRAMGGCFLTKWWLEKENFKDIVSKAWNEPCKDTNAMDRW